MFKYVKSLQHGVLYLLLVSMWTMNSCQPKVQKQQVVELETYLIYARENGQPASMPLLPGSLSIKYVSALFENTEKIYNNLKTTYGYDVFWLKGQTRDILQFSENVQELTTRLDTFMIRLNYQSINGDQTLSLHLLSGYRQPKEKLSTQLGFSEGKTIVIGMGQPQGDKRAALFLVLHPTVKQVSSETDVIQLGDFALKDMTHQLQLYRLQKQLRQNLGLPAKIEDNFENLYEFFKVTQKPKLIKKVKPQYPDKAQKSGAEGTVVVSVVIREDGSVGKALVFFGKNPQLDSAAIAAAQKCIFIPGEVSGKKVKTMMNIPFRFNLKGSAPVSYSVMGRPFTNDLHITEWPQLKNKIEPKLPKHFDRSRLPDWNIVQVLIDKQGMVRTAEIVKKANNTILDTLSLQAARQLRFSPGKMNGAVVEMRMQIPFKYSK